LGFGALAPGTWISPRSLSPEAEGKWRELDVWQYLEVFSAEHVGPSNPRDVVAHAWPQLPALGDRYRAYVAKYEPALCRFEADVLGDEECFTTRLRALPPSLLPEDWPRPSGQLLFRELQQVLAGPAERFFDTIYEEGETDDKGTRS
jgi:phenylacetic acid degradation operon negative regulatory protein